LKVLLFDNYDSFSWNIVELLRSLNVYVIICKNDEQWTDDFDAAILSPGPNIPQSSGRLLDFIAEFAESKPMLGICLGHQALALHFGAKLFNMDEPLHGEERALALFPPSVLFSNLSALFPVGLYHSWCIADKDLPQVLKVTARTADGLIMALEHNELPLYGVQFHPESFISANGKEIMQNFLNVLKKD